MPKSCRITGFDIVNVFLKISNVVAKRKPKHYAMKRRIKPETILQQTLSNTFLFNKFNDYSITIFPSSLKATDFLSLPFLMSASYILPFFAVSVLSTSTIFQPG